MSLGKQSVSVFIVSVNIFPSFNPGPDDVLQSTNLSTTKRDEPVKLRMGDSGPLAVKPISVPTLFQETVKKLPDGLALAHKRNGEWVNWTYKQYYDDVVKAAKSFIKVFV